MLAAILILRLFFVVYADGNISIGSITADEMDVIPGKSIGKLAYGMAPDNIFPFVYKGYTPAETLDIDTNICVIGTLYVFDMGTNELSQIQMANETLECYASSKDYLYCITVDGKILKTDYTGSFFECIYTSEVTDIYRPVVFGNYLAFIEGGNCIVIINTTTNEVESVASGYTVSSMFMFDDDKIIWRDEDGVPNYYNLTSEENTVLGNEYEVNCIISPYISCGADEEETENSTCTLINFDPDTNDVSIPLPEYSAVPGTGFVLNNALTHFTDNYASSNECDGFAKYAHDRFLHIEDWSRPGPSWVANTGTNPDYHENRQFSSLESMKAFFASLTKGAFVRYVSVNDETPSDGTHSIFFDKVDSSGLGIWVYECNQDGQCGVGYQYYPFATIFGHYIRALYYVDHDFSTQKVFENASYHKYNCENCDGYLRQLHSNPQRVIVTQQMHNTNYPCCGVTQVSSHTAVRQSVATSTQNHRIYYSCCSGYITAAHSFSSGICTVCGYVKGSNVVEPINV